MILAENPDNYQLLSGAATFLIGIATREGFRLRSWMIGVWDKMIRFIEFTDQFRVQLKTKLIQADDALAIAERAAPDQMRPAFESIRHLISELRKFADSTITINQ